MEKQLNPLEVEFRRDERFMRYLTVKLDKHAIAWAERRREKLKVKANKSVIMSSIEQQAKGKKDGEIRYLTPLNIETSKTKKYCRFKNLESSMLITKMQIGY